VLVPLIKALLLFLSYYSHIIIRRLAVRIRNTRTNSKSLGCECEFSLAHSLCMPLQFSKRQLYFTEAVNSVRQPARESERVCVIWQPLFMCIHHGIVRI
jgi:hypothetical protein